MFANYKVGEFWRRGPALLSSMQKDVPFMEAEFKATKN
ncbi:hypothetical protein P606_13285 [Comamonas thiooxydans]|uniref:Uncharacterized protein n=1 Tax=Comamonas thiooxydans TaxID=363952 RepID=A0A0E3B8D5_9BURK|nr:hypothetical protein P245_25275 [Comamonas thiooxydans]KGH23001.1 hypothetical protein P606_13285 [Comamonas thiooxydans]